jgi:hypothetical protein
MPDGADDINFGKQTRWNVSTGTIDQLAQDGVQPAQKNGPAEA